MDGNFPSCVQGYRRSLYFPHFFVQLCLGARMFVDRGADCHMHRHVQYLQLPLELDCLWRADWLRLGCDQPAVQWHANDVCQQHHERRDLLHFGQDAGAEPERDRALPQPELCNLSQDL